MGYYKVILERYNEIYIERETENREWYYKVTLERYNEIYIEREIEREWKESGLL